MDRIGRYKIVRELGRGAMGVVYHAIDPNIGRPVAIKTIQLGGPRKPDEQERLRERLFREARSAGMLSHPGIVTIYDVEQQGELAYIAMEFVDGPTLDQLLSDAQPLAANRMFGILAQTAAALDYAATRKPRLTRRHVWGIVVRTVGYTATALLCSMLVRHVDHVWWFAIRVGVVTGVVTGVGIAVVPLIEYYADNLPERRLGAFGIVLIFCGFALQSLQYWVVLLDVRVT